MLFCDTFQRSLDDLPALKCGLVQVNSPCGLHVFSPTHVIHTLCYARRCVCHAWISWPASSSVELLPCVAKGTRCKPLHDVRFCDNTRLFVFAETFVFLFLICYLFFEERRRQK